MKLKILAEVLLYEVTGHQTAQIKVPAGTYSVNLQKNPSGRNNDPWYIFSKPEEIGQSFQGKTIGAAKIWVMNQTVMSII